MKTKAHFQSKIEIFNEWYDKENIETSFKMFSLRPQECKVQAFWASKCLFFDNPREVYYLILLY